MLAGIRDWDGLATSGLVHPDPKIDTELASWTNHPGEAGVAGLVDRWVERSLEELEEDLAEAVTSLDFLIWIVGSITVFGFAAFRASLEGQLPAEQVDIGVRRALAVVLASARLGEEFAGEERGRRVVRPAAGMAGAMSTGRGRSLSQGRSSSSGSRATQSSRRASGTTHRFGSGHYR